MTCFDNSPERPYGGDTDPGTWVDPVHEKELEEYEYLVRSIERVIPYVREKVPGSEVLEDKEIFQIIGAVVEEKSIPVSKIYQILDSPGYAIPVINNTFFKICEKE